ncbi:MAG: hypothetical protein ACKOZW_13010, partial [Cyanobium sp.]
LQPLASSGASLTPMRPPSASGLTHSGLLLGSQPLGRPPGAMADAFATTSAPPAGANLASSGSPVPSAPAGSAELALLPAGPGTPSTLPLATAGFSRAELLGGPISLNDLQEGAMPPMALAERGRLSLSADPLAALPEPWREPMRRALSSLPVTGGQAARVNQARLIHVPSSRISRPTEVPLALQSDGSVDILSRPDNEAVVEEIRDWSARQTPPTQGTVAPALVHLHPVSDAQPLRPTAADLLEAAPAAMPLGTPQPGPQVQPPTSPEPGSVR